MAPETREATFQEHVVLSTQKLATLRKSQVDVSLSFLSLSSEVPIAHMPWISF
jgi:hypothetical protein